MSMADRTPEGHTWRELWARYEDCRILERSYVRREGADVLLSEVLTQDTLRDWLRRRRQT